MILARAALERTPTFIWENESGEINGGNVQNGDGTYPLEGQLSVESYSCYKSVKCFDVRVNGNSNISNPTLCSSSEKCDIRSEANNDECEGMDVDGCGYIQTETDEMDNDIVHSGTVEELWIIGERQVEGRRAAKTIKTFSSERIALQALWTKFVNTPTSPESYLDCIVIREKERLRIYSDGGREFLVALPFDISGAWNTKYGLLLERSTGNSTTSSTNATKPPDLLALHHPLDDLTRIVVKTGHGGNESVREWNNSQHKIVFTSANPSICVTYDTKTCFHNIWLIRQTYLTDDECQKLLSGGNTNENISTSQQQEMEENEVTPLNHRSHQPQHLISSLLNSTRFKQFHNQLISSKQTTPSSGLPSVVESPTLQPQSQPISSRRTQQGLLGCLVGRKLGCKWR